MQKVLCFVAALLLMACSSEENVMDEAHKVDVGKGITFQFNEEAFVPGTISKKGTRATQIPEVIDLGNGLTAEVALEPDTLGLSQTRAANPIPDGHYKIYAIDASNVRHDGIDGNVSGGVFTPNPSKQWKLNSGETYTFVCINDAVVDNGTSLSYTYSDDQTALQPLIGVTQYQVSNADNDVVSFVMRHQNARVRFQITSFTAPCMNLKLTFSTDPTIAPCRITNYNLKGSITGYIGNTVLSSSGAIPFSANKPYTPSSLTETYKTSTNYFYFPGHWDASTYQRNTWGGTIYGESDALVYNLRSFALAKGSLTFFERNHSYVYNVTIRPSVLYLFSDGTVGTLGDKGTRTPIAVVVKEKLSASDKGLAVALKNANGNSNGIYYGQSASKRHTYNNTKQYEADYSDAASDMNGYKWTYDPASSKDGTSKALNNSDYGIFYTAANYNPGVSVAPTVGKWFLPAIGEWAQAIEYLTRKTMLWQKDFGVGVLKVENIDFSKLNKYFEDAGGTKLLVIGGYPITKNYWTSSELKNSSSTNPVMSYSEFQNRIFILNGARDGVYNVRSFVHF